MAKDYAKITQSKKTTPHWSFKMVLVLGVFIGGYVAATYYDYESLKHSLSTRVAKVLPPKKKQVVTATKPVELPKPKFEFYTILPKQRVITAKPASQVSDKSAKVDTNKLQTKSYLVQVASFKHLDEADSLKAELILKGYEASVVKFSNGKTAWYRVNLGPFPSAKLAHATQSKLSRQDKLEGMVKRIA